MKKFTVVLVLALAALISVNVGAIEVPAIPSHGKIANENSASFYDDARKVYSKGEVARIICERFEGTPPLIANWRNNHVPISDAQGEIAQLLDTVPATQADRNNWHAWVEAVYKSDVTAKDIEVVITKRCDKLPDPLKKHTK